MGESTVLERDYGCFIERGDWHAEKLGGTAKRVRSLRWARPHDGPQEAGRAGRLRTATNSVLFYRLTVSLTRSVLIKCAYGANASDRMPDRPRSRVDFYQKREIYIKYFSFATINDR